ncbi:MAG: trypsin-like peptidase domain-containing protein [Opitutaceae bacterium]|nr:trypsin-like peptidase domain-containing protein [Opitutaceae bacterium]
MLKKRVAPSITHRGKLRIAFFGFVMGLSCLGFLFTGCQTTNSTFSPGVHPGFENLLNAVVRIDVREVTFEDGAKRYVAGVGSGVILSRDGLILTNAHVVSPRAVEISVTLANLERVNATLVGWDHWTDLALIRINMDAASRRKLKFSHASFGSSDLLKPGQTVYAVGTPHGLSRTVTRGIISNTDRYFETTDGVKGYETGSFSTWLQTDAAINPGNSGGPLVTSDGKIIGINTRTYLGAQNLGFAIPSMTAIRIKNELLKKGRVERSYIGVIPGVLQDLEGFFQLDANSGMLINNVDLGSPSADAGLRAGDIILAINEDKVDGRFPEQLPSIQNRIASFPVGSTIDLLIKRGDEGFIFPVVTELLESRVGEEWGFDQWGLSVQNISKAYAREHRLESDRGVLVIGTQSAYPAAKAGIRKGDIITTINQIEIEDLLGIRQIYVAFEENPESLLFETLRNRSVSFYVLNP